MTTYQQLLQTIGQLKSIEASLELFSMETQDKQAAQIFKEAYDEATKIVEALEVRQMQMEKEEPQFKTF
ncbi:DUF1657 domain-containing protein [Pullulanibacillus sp. KACC 23026]|uniref:DUF1657 domain-containing protein n=1 Tax=Pullulanibacillus sp. KACC 23026 TaxID=3028315 RepID=UPI0023B06957|nr:DUF1657 domain-containing protein [Pullulanibacillus sp. KACC 23026]WEG11321.1 DUF1657 domain-containing protein [Pullulanibacillus sp. KACC 23026]